MARGWALGQRVAAAIQAVERQAFQISDEASQIAIATEQLATTGRDKAGNMDDILREPRGRQGASGLAQLDVSWEKTMHYSEGLENRIQTLASQWPGTGRKNLFGGVCHLLHGNMFCGVWRDNLILRLGEEGAAEALTKPHVRPFDVTGRPMKGWVMVEPAGVGDDGTLAEWLARARAFAQSLPPK